MGCITNKPGHFTLPLLARTALAPYFDIVVSGDMLPKKKPDPMPITYACGFFAALPGQVVLIGDSDNDYHAACAAGCPSLGVSYGYVPRGDVRSIGFDAIVDSFAEALKLIQYA
jgi:phosphoglycolate phosphatase